MIPLWRVAGGGWSVCVVMVLLATNGHHTLTLSLSCSYFYYSLLSLPSKLGIGTLQIELRPWMLFSYGFSVPWKLCSNRLESTAAWENMLYNCNSRCIILASKDVCEWYELVNLIDFEPHLHYHKYHHNVKFKLCHYHENCRGMEEEEERNDIQILGTGKSGGTKIFGTGGPNLLPTSHSCLCWRSNNWR